MPPKKYKPTDRYTVIIHQTSVNRDGLVVGNTLSGHRTNPAFAVLIRRTLITAFVVALYDVASGGAPIRMTVEFLSLSRSEIDALHDKLFGRPLERVRSMLKSARFNEVVFTHSEDFTEFTFSPKLRAVK